MDDPTVIPLPPGASFAEDAGFGEGLQAARTNPNLMRQGAKGREGVIDHVPGLAEDPGVMDPRHARWKESQQNQEILGNVVDVATAAIPLAGPAVKGARAVGRALDTVASESLARPRGMPISQEGAIKPPGGAWHPDTVKRLSGPLNRSLPSPDENPAYWGWSDKAVKNYLNKYAGTERDPLKDIEIPHGEGTARWEDLTDKAFTTKAAKYNDHLPELKNAPPDEPIWQTTDSPGSGSHGDFGASSKSIQSYLSHVGDYLKQNVAPEKLGQYDLVRAVKETAANDARVAKEMAKSAQADVASMPVHKEYPTGFKWVELKLPESLNEKQWAQVKETPKGWVPTDADGKVINNSYTGKPTEPVKTPEEAWLAGQLAKEGNTMGHCVGGYCDEVASGQSKIYSLRGPNGKSHVTVEVNPSTTVNHLSDQVSEQLMAQAEKEVPPGPDRFEEIDSKFHELSDEWFKSHPQPDSIVQIKGKQNRAPVKDYQPYVQDFVRSGKWGDVGDLENTGLKRTQDLARGPNAKRLIEKKKFGDFVTTEEWNKAVEADNLSRGQKGAALPATMGTAGAAAAGVMAAPDARGAEPMALPPGAAFADTPAGGQQSLPPGADLSNAYDTDQDYAPTVTERVSRRIGSAADEMAQRKGVLAKVGQVGEGAAEGAIEMATGIAGSAAGGVAGAARTLRGLFPGETLDEAAQAGADVVKGVQNFVTVRPKSAAGRLTSELLATPLALASEFTGDAAAAAGKALGNEAAGRTVGEAIPAALATVVPALRGKPAAKLSVAGKDYTPLRRLEPEQEARLQRQADVGAKPTLGSVTRKPEQMRYEEQKAAQTEGLPLAQRRAENNAAMINAIEEVDKRRAGKATTTNVSETGKAIYEGLAEKEKASDANVSALYNKARAAKETEAPVSRAAFNKFFDDNKSHIAAGINNNLKALQSRYKDLVAANKGKLTINDAELLYREANSLSPTNGSVKGFKRFINEQTQNVGGQLYRDARAARLRHAVEFEDRAAISDILSLKRGSRTDFKTATENIFDRTVVRGSMEELKDVMSSLLDTDPKTNPKAWQAVREVQKQTIDHVLDQSLNKGTLDMLEKNNLSPDAFRKALTEKMGRATVQKIRYLLGDDAFKRLLDINKANREMKVPTGKVAGSDTVANLKMEIARGMADDAANHFFSGGITGAIKSGVQAVSNWRAGKAKARLAEEQQQEALNPRRAPFEEVRKMAKAEKSVNKIAARRRLLEKAKGAAAVGATQQSEEDPAGMFQ